MSWRDNLQPASFRGVPFLVNAITRTQDLQADEQVFPGRDDPGDAVSVERLGIGPRRWRIDAFVVGDDYDERLAALEAALEEPGAGRLVHPYRGELVVSVVGTIQTTEERRRLGFARVSFTVVVTESPTLRRTPDTQAVIERDLDEYLDALAGDFEEQYDTDDVAEEFQTSSRDVFSSAADALADVYAAVVSGIGEVSDFATDVGDAVRDVQSFAAAPFTAASALIRAIGTITSAPERLLGTGLSLESRGGAVVDSLLAAVRPLIHFGEDLAAIAETTSNRAAEARLRDSVVQLVRGAAIGQTILGVASLPFDSRTQAIDVRDELVGALDALVDDGSAGGDTVSGAALYEAIARARAATVGHLSAIARTLPELTTYEVPSDLPALVIAHLLYADATREAEIVTRNDPPTPGLIPVGTVLEVVRAG